MAKETQRDKFCPMLSISGGVAGDNTLEYCRKEDCAWYSKPNHECAVWLMAEIMINKFISDNPQAKMH